jgi:S1-C subfamily serine protease
MVIAGASRSPQPQSAAAAQVASAPASAGARRMRKGAIIALGACTAAVVGLGSVSGAWTFATVVARGAATSQAATDHAQFEQALYDSYGDGSASDYSNGTGAGPSNGTDSLGGASSTAATAAQSSGIVLINTVLSYQQAQAAGTGIVLTADGEILTNNHVIAGSTSISVTIPSTGKTYDASVVGTDATDDVAVLQLSGASDLATANIDSSGEVGIGDAVTGVGNAGGTGTLTAAPGSVTALETTITTQAEGAAASETLTGLIETNADIQAGDSGGPLYDADNEVIGIDTAASEGSAQPQGYAIPIEDALDIAEQIESGTATDTVSIGYPAFLGVQVGSTDDGTSGLFGEYGSQSGYATPGSSVAGAPIAGVVPAGPAAAAGLVAGDTITALDGTAIGSASELTQALAGYKPGQTTTITWADAAGASHSATVTLAAGPAA